MRSFPIGVMLESFRLPINEALNKAHDLGVQGIQVYTTRGELAPQNLNASQRKEFLQQVKDKGLVISALCGDLGHGFGNLEKNPELIEQSKRIVDLSLEWECGIVTTHIGVVPEDNNHPRYKIMQDACSELAQYADSVKARFAVETGPETSKVLKGFLDSLNSRGVSVNMDPANLVMVTGDDPVEAVHTLKDYIVHTHAKDGKRLYYREPEKVYGIVYEESLDSSSFQELPLGEGDVDFKRYLQALEDIGYTGFLTIEREVGEDPEGDIRKAVEYLRTFFV
ncbi:MAG: sugar phosphate isomerase/epimerase family protein [Christensenellales bacterium]|jgi:L-ribulose-5-phosphate 3-epimerase|nr:sugar phosphate isomerase/epimerase [Clostridiales bacterium]